MGFFDFIKKKLMPQSSTQDGSASPMAVDPAQIEEEKKQADLEKLKAFESKYKKGAQPTEERMPQVEATETDVENVALKIKNPFRGY